MILKKNLVREQIKIQTDVITQKYLKKLLYINYFLHVSSLGYVQGHCHS